MNEEMDGGVVPELVSPGVGATLKAAREARGMSVQEVGTRLRLMTRQIEAIEAEDFASLGQQVFARGFVRNYARMLGLNEEPLLTQMSPARTTVAPQTENLPFAPKPGFWSSPLVMSTIGAIFLVITVPVLLYLWLNSGDNEETVAPVVEQTVHLPVAVPVTQTAPEMQPELPPVTTVVTPRQASDPAHTVSSSGTTLPGAAQPLAAAVQPSAPPMPTAKPAANTSANAAMITATQSIQFYLAAPSWLQVRDGTGKMVYSALSPAGSNVEVKGTPPFNLVVGNAANVQVTYKNKPVDIKPYIDVTVARFSLD